jgi:hypothetical protein
MSTVNYCFKSTICFTHLPCDCKDSNNEQDVVYILLIYVQPNEKLSNYCEYC